MARTKAPVAHDHVVEGLWGLVGPVTELDYDPVNARDHSRRNLDAIKASLRAFGQRTPLVVQVTDKGQKIVRKGNGTLQAAKEMVDEGDSRWGHLAMVLVTEDHTTATGYAIADNRTAELAQWNDNLGSLLASLSEDSPDLLGATGFDDIDLRALLDDLSSAGELQLHQELDLDLTEDDILQGRIVVTCHLDEVDQVRDKVREFLEGWDGVQVS